MIKVTELGGIYRVFNLKTSTLRLLARQSKTISDSEVSEELKIAEKQGLVLLQEMSELKKVEKKGDNE